MLAAMRAGARKFLRSTDTAGKLGLVETAARFQRAKECAGDKEMRPVDVGQEGRARERASRQGGAGGQEVGCFKHETLKSDMTRTE